MREYHLCGKMLPLYKSGEKSAVKNNHPISLTSVVSKVMERIIRQHLYDHLSTNHLVSDVQHGFCPGRSCESQLLDTVHVWNKSMEDRKLVYVLFLDISKAFDKVPHAYLLEKLKMVGIDGGLLSWIRDYLTNRNKGALLKDVFLGGFL